MSEASNLIASIIHQGVSAVVEEFFDQCDCDSRGMTYVDGEEGDYGVIVYSYEGDVVATESVYGGDVFDCRLSQYGREKFKEFLFARMGVLLETL